MSLLRKLMLLVRLLLLALALAACGSATTPAPEATEAARQQPTEAPTLTSQPAPTLPATPTGATAPTTPPTSTPASLTPVASSELLDGLPLPPDITDLETGTEQLSFRSGNAPAEVATFYREQLVAEGWMETGGSTINGLQIITFSRDRRVLSVAITDEGGTANVQINVEQMVMENIEGTDGAGNEEPPASEE